MKSEIFVVNIFNISEKARLAVGKYLGLANPDEVRKTLRSARRLEQALRNRQVPFENTFEALDRAIIEEFNRQRVHQLTRRHVEELLNVDVQVHLGEALGCHSRDVLNTLLSVPHLQNTFEAFYSSGRTAPTDIAQLLTDILDRAQEIELSLDTSPNNWEKVFRLEHWLLSDAEQMLADLGERQGIQDPYEGLAALIDEYEVEMSAPAQLAKQSQGDNLDYLGVLEVRRRSAFLISRLEDRAKELLQRASAIQVDSPQTQLLSTILPLYELGQIAKGLRNYLDFPFTLDNILTKESIVQYQVDEDKVTQGRALEFVEVSIYKVRELEFGSFEVRCFLSNRRNPQPLLQAQDVPIRAFHQLKKDISRLSPSELSPVGASLAERLLNTSFPIMDPDIMLLAEAVDQLGNRFIQAAALSLDQPVDIKPTTLSQSLNNRLPYQDLPAALDPSYDASVEQIITHIDQEYSQAGIKPRVIRGLVDDDG